MKKSDTVRIYFMHALGPKDARLPGALTALCKAHDVELLRVAPGLSRPLEATSLVRQLRGVDAVVGLITPRSGAPARAQIVREVAAAHEENAGRHHSSRIAPVFVFWEPSKAEQERERKFEHGFFGWKYLGLDRDSLTLFTIHGGPDDELFLRRDLAGPLDLRNPEYRQPERTQQIIAAFVVLLGGLRRLGRLRKAPKAKG